MKPAEEKIVKAWSGQASLEMRTAMAGRILVINDAQEILELFCEILEPEGYEVIMFSFAPRELDEIERLRPDLIILDVIFGSERLGWQLLQKLKMHRSTNTIPVIVCTAATREVRDIEGYLQAQGIQLVPKPFDIDALLLAVERAFQVSEHAGQTLLNRPDDSARETNQ